MTFLIKSTPENRKLIFNAIKAKILKHLEELEREESGELKKTFSELTGLLLKGGKSLPVGTIREWKGKKFIKVAPGKWKPKYDSETRGAKLAISALKKKIALCEDEREMMALVLENRDRFSDKDGNPLPFVQQLSEFISQTQQKKAGEKTANKKAAISGEDDGEPHDNFKGKKIKNELSKESYTKILRKKLKDNLRSQFGFHKNKKTGIEANLSGSSVDKMSSDKAIEKSKKNGFTVDEHFEVANKIVSLYENADLIKVSSDKRGSPDIKSIKRFESEVTLKNGERANAYITVKENIQNGHKIYSVEVMELEKNSRSENRAGGWQDNQKTPLTSTISIPQSGEKSRDIKEKLEQWQKEGRKIVQDEHGLNFYEGMTPSEKIEWIEAEIKRLQEAAKSPFLGQSGVIRYAKDDFYEGLDKDYYKNKYGPYGYKKYIKRDLKKIINKEMQEAENRHEKRKKEYEAEIKEYQEDIKYYEKQVSTPLTKSIVWLQNYLSKSGQKKESAIEVLRKRLEKERRA